MMEKKEFKSKQVINNFAPVNNQIIIESNYGDLPKASVDNLSNQNQSQSDAAAINLIKNTLAKADIDQSIVLLKAMTSQRSKSLLDEVILIESQWRFLKKDKSKGIIENENYVIERNRISDAIMSSLSNLTEQN